MTKTIIMEFVPQNFVMIPEKEEEFLIAFKSLGEIVAKKMETENELLVSIKVYTKDVSK